MYTTSLPLYQTSNFFTSPFTFSVIPTALIYRQRQNRKLNTVTGCSSGCLIMWEHYKCHHSEAGFEAVEGRPVVAVLVSALAEEQGVLVEEEMPLHGFESGQLFHSHCRPFVADPHAKAALHHDAAQLAEITLCQRDRRIHKTQMDLQLPAN